MKLFVDTFVFVRLSAAPDTLSSELVDVLADIRNDCLASPISLYEIAWKARRGGLGADIAAAFPALIARYAMAIAPITLEIAKAAAELPSAHADPFDRMIAAQARAESALVISPDPAFDALGAARFWR